VTGGNGFLGRHLCAELLRRGWRVRSLHRGDAPALGAMGVEQVRGDVCCREDFEAAAQGVSAIYHLAGRVSRSPEEAGAMYALHVQGTRNFVSVVERLGVERALYLSTSGVVGVSDSPSLATEESPLAWSLIRAWPYYESKAFAEEEVRRAVARGAPIRVARPSLLLGPGDPTGGSHDDILRFLSGDVRAALPGGLSFVDARDVAAFLPTLLERGEVGVGYLLGAENLSVRAFLTQLAALTGVSAPALDLPARLAERAEGPLKWLTQRKSLGGLSPQTFEMGRRFWYVSSDRARALGFSPRAGGVTLADALDDLKARGFY
jgi:dihydroflavonol-4-reductase